LNLPPIHHHLSEYILITFIRSANIDSIMHHKGIQKTVLPPKSQRIDAALQFLAKHPDMSASKTTKIFTIDRSTISKRLAGISASQRSWAEARQLLSPVEEEVLTKWAL
jgi:predicted HTH transcriptional regulator